MGSELFVKMPLCNTQLGIKFNFLSFSSRVGVVMLFCGFITRFDMVLGGVMSSTATETLRRDLRAHGIFLTMRSEDVRAGTIFK